MKHIRRFNESILDGMRNRLGQGDSFCGECGVKMNKGDSFCGECGTKQDEVTTGDLSHMKLPKIDIKNVMIVKDGGSLSIDSNLGRFMVDKKIGTKTPYLLTLNGKMVDERYVKAMVKSLEDYSKETDSDFSGYIDGLNKSKNNEIGPK